MKKFFKFLTITACVFLAVVIAIGFFLFKQLPSASSLGQKLNSRNETSQAALAANVANVENSISASGDDTSISAEELAEVEDEIVEPDGTLQEALVTDLLSQQKPLSDFCSSLKNAKDGAFEQEEFGEAFNRSLDEEKRDPRIQAVKPIIRYVLRLPKMNDLIEEVKAAANRNDEGFLKKAEFYSQALMAFGEMKAHKSDIESMMDRGYLFLGLNKLLAKRPELLNDFKLQNYCNGVELSFNQARPVDFENEKKDFLKFLDEMGVTPKEIGFNTEYKSNVDFNFSGKAATIEGGWLSDLVKSDVDMEADLKEPN